MKQLHILSIVIVFAILLTPVAFSQSGPSITTDKNSYSNGEKIHFTVNGFSAGTTLAHFIDFELTHDNYGTSNTWGTYRTTTGGMTDFSRLNYESIPGTWSLKAHNGLGESAITKIQFVGIGSTHPVQSTMLSDDFKKFQNKTNLDKIKLQNKISGNTGSVNFIITVLSDNIKKFDSLIANNTKLIEGIDTPNNYGQFVSSTQKSIKDFTGNMTGFKTKQQTHESRINNFNLIQIAERLKVIDLLAENLLLKAGIASLNATNITLQDTIDFLNGKITGNKSFAIEQQKEIDKISGEVDFLMSQLSP